MGAARILVDHTILGLWSWICRDTALDQSTTRPAPPRSSSRTPGRAPFYTNRDMRSLQAALAGRWD